MARQLANECWWVWEFKKLLIEVRMSQKELAAESKLSPQYIGNIINRDKKAPWDTYVKIYETFVKCFIDKNNKESIEDFAKKVSYVLAKRMIDISSVSHIAVLDTSKEKDYYGFPNPHEILEEGK